jgi:DNA-binding transcriptional regulator YiaG
VKLIDRLRAEQSLPAPAERKSVREGAGVSKRAIALELDVSPMTIGRWESGDRHPRGDMAVRYGELLTELSKLSEPAVAEAS